MSPVFWLLGVIGVVALVYGLVVLVRAYVTYRGTRVITCPETQTPAAVTVDARHAGVSAVFGAPDLRLSTCTRWPERQDCGQQCLAQIEAAPEACLIRTLLERWYEGKRCAICHRAIGRINWIAHVPGLLAPSRQTVEWSDVPAETLPDVFKSHQPVCWDCHVVETFRRQRPDLVIEGPSRQPKPH